MKSLSMDTKVAKPKVEPFSLKDAPSLIERIWSAQKISVEAQKERKAGFGQTLTALGSYWKGRKPLILVRACILGAILPATGDDETDIAIFERLMLLDDEAFLARELKMSASTIARLAIDAGGLSRANLPKLFAIRGIKEDPTEQDFEDGLARNRLTWRPEATQEDIKRLRLSALSTMNYVEKVSISKRPEELEEAVQTDWKFVNSHLGTHATSLAQLIEQLGLMRFGSNVRIADTFSGGGSIPFEAARLGCDVYASDLNPLACLLTWGAANIVGASSQTALKAERERIAKLIDSEIVKLGFEHDSQGNRAKTFLYCVEIRCPQSGWLVPVLPSLVISRTKNVIARLEPDHANKRFHVRIVSDVTMKEVALAENGTLQDGNVVYQIDRTPYSTSLKLLRGDYKTEDRKNANRLRLWSKEDIAPRPDDVFQERLYCVQWVDKVSAHKSRSVTFFAEATKDDLRREIKVAKFTADHMEQWQSLGIVPDMPIERGENTTQPIRERGWTYWHHLFNPRQLMQLAIIAKHMRSTPSTFVLLPKIIDYCSKLCRWDAGHAGSSPQAVATFTNQALNTLFNYGCKASSHLISFIADDLPERPIKGKMTIATHSSLSIPHFLGDIIITDPPYADAVNYHEITEFFIAWLRGNPPAPFQDWIWDSRRPLAIKGDGDEFRHNMVSAYSGLSHQMSENGVQIVMFTHQSASVWGDMAQIFWGAGLQVMAAWYIATETTSELKKGGYVQGTVILVLRKRTPGQTGYKDEIVQEVKAEVSDQISTMSGLNQTLKGRGRVENLFEDADLQMAGYAAALRVLTRYEKIDGTDMTKEALRPRRAGERNLVGEIIDFAVQVANEHMVPEYMAPKLWEGLSGPERFYFKMMDIETTSLRKLDNYQNFAKAFRVTDYGALMGSMEPNKARLKTAKEFKKAGFEIPEFGPSATRAALYAIFELENDVEGDDVLSHLKDMLSNYHNKRDDLAAIADYIARKRELVDETESRAARILHGLIRNERLG
jgi:putative DNA methylase